ncbi:MAG: TonB-dependent receptor [Desulfosoma sp.]|uniref:TonB-dependent receptor n=1 Tax=Desulfosoma sp. TaxID=2603217 RepID=UPI00404A9166
MKLIGDRRWVPAAAIVACLFAPSSILAEEQQTFKLEPMMVTATKTEVKADTIPFTAHSVDRETLEAQPSFFMNNVGELIRDLPGVHVGQYYPWGPPWIHLRGTGYFIGRTVYLVDGLPIWSFMSTTLNPNDIERVDVLLGPSSALYGANASGGAVNFITRSGTKGMGAKGQIAYGTKNTIRPHVSIGDAVNQWRYYFSYSGDYSDGYKMKPVDDALQLWSLGKKQYLKEASLEDNRYRNSYVAGKADWANEHGTKFSMAVNYARRYLYGGQSNLILDDTGSQVINTLKAETPLGGIGKIRLSGAFQYYDHPQQYNGGLSLVGGTPVLNSTIFQKREWKVRRLPVELQTDWYLGSNNTLTAGVFWSRENEKRDDFFLLTGKKSLFKVTTDQTASYLQDQMVFLDDRLSLIAGIRYDHWEYKDIFDTSSNPQKPEDVSKETWTYRGGGKYRFNENLAVRSSIGTAYWPGLPLWFFQNIKSGNTWREANPNLDPEKTWMADLGLELDFPRFGTSIGVTGYYGKIRDMVSYRYDENPAVPGGSIVRTQNLGGAEIYGVETLLEQRITDKLWFMGSLTLNHSRIIDDPKNGGHQLRNAPDYWGSLGLRYINPDIVNANILLRFSDDRYYDDENTELPFFHMRPYKTLDLRIWKDWRLADKWIMTTSISGVNIFDKYYETEIVYVNPGRYIEGMVAFRYLF